MQADPLVVVVSREDVQRADVQPTLMVLQRLLASPTTIREWSGRVDVAFHGYDHGRRELYEVPEVRNFVYQLDEAFPYWLYFLTKSGTGLQALAWCYLPPYLTEEAQREIWPRRLMELLDRRWEPALGHIASHVGHSATEIESMIADAGHYFAEGPRTPFDVDAP